MNKVILIGRLTRDPEIKNLNDDKKVCRLTLAVDRVRKSERDTETADFIPIIAWNKLADVLSKYTVKGSKILVAGRLQLRKWEDDNGNNHISTEVIAQEIELLDYKKSNNQNNEKQETHENNLQDSDIEGFYEETITDDDLPF